MEDKLSDILKFCCKAAQHGTLVLETAEEWSVTEGLQIQLNSLTHTNKVGERFFTLVKGQDIVV